MAIVPACSVTLKSRHLKLCGFKGRIFYLFCSTLKQIVQYIMRINHIHVQYIKAYYVELG